MEVLQPYFTRLLPDPTDLTNERRELTPASRPHLSKPANRRPRLELCSQGGRATQVTREKNRKERRKKNSRACYGVRVKETRISTLLYQLNQYLWIEHTQVLQQVESLTANSFVAPLKIISPFLSPFTSIEFPVLLFALLITWKKVNPCYFYFNLCFNCSFYPCGP